MQRWTAYALLIFSTLVWAGNQVVAKVGLREASPLTLTTLRFVPMAAVLLAVARAAGAPLRFDGGQWRQFALLGLVGVFGFNLLLLTGLQYTSVAESGLVQAAMPIVGGYLGWRFRGEPLTWLRRLAMGLSVAGVALVMVTGPPLPDVPGARRLLGDLLVFGATCAWALYSLLGKGAMQRSTPLAATAMASLAGAAMFLAAAALPGAPPVWREAAGLSPAGRWVVAYMVLASGAGGFWAWYQGLRRVEVGAASTFLNLLPLWTVLMGAAFLGEQVTPWQLLGGGLAVAGCLLAALPGPRTRPEPFSRERRLG